MAKKKKKAVFTTDRGTDEARAQGEFVEVPTATTGVVAIRSVTADPLTTYYRRKAVTHDQFLAGERFGDDFRRAGLDASPSQTKYGAVGGGASDEYLERVNDTKKRVRRAVAYVGWPMSSIVEHVAGQCHTAGSWSFVAGSKRPDHDGMVALRLALDGLVIHYKIKVVYR